MSTDTPAIAISELGKTYASGEQALNNINLEIQPGEIFALLGPNGAGKTTLISIICGIVNPGPGTVRIEGFDIVREWRAARSLIGLVPQELHTDAFESVWNTVSFSRGLFGLAPKPAHIERLLRDLALWDKRDSEMRTLSGGMKRRVMIAKALAHEPRVLFLDEPTAGVDVELRRGMWNVVRRLRDNGVTIVLTTHYIEEAEEMADRVGVIHRGQLVEVEATATLMHKLGRKQLTVALEHPLQSLPPALAGQPLSLFDDGRTLVYEYDAAAEDPGVRECLAALEHAGIAWRDISTRQSSLEDIFVNLVNHREDGPS